MRERERERERDREKNNAGETNIDPDMPGRKGGKKLPRDFAAMFDITENPYLYIYIYNYTHTYTHIYLPAPFRPYSAASAAVWICRPGLRKLRSRSNSRVSRA